VRPHFHFASSPKSHTNSACSGYGYQVRIVSDLPNLDNDLAASMEWALAEIKKIQTAARSGNPISKPRWPMLVLRTPKGLGGPKIVHGEIVEGSFHAHQVPLPLAKTSEDERVSLQQWLKSYKPEELFTKEGVPTEAVLSVIPEINAKKLGQRVESYAGYKPIQTPDWMEFAVEKGSQESCMKAVGRFLKEVVVEYAFFAISPRQSIH
jgi:xylulose-5-phosphate/fructose-6-phosphate phosphoketolase